VQNALRLSRNKRQGDQENENTSTFQVRFLVGRAVANRQKEINYHISWQWETVTLIGQRSRRFGAKGIVADTFNSKLKKTRRARITRFASFRSSQMSSRQRWQNGFILDIRRRLSVFKSPILAAHQEKNNCK
jgi:hypothetical protein